MNVHLALDEFQKGDSFFSLHIFFKFTDLLGIVTNKNSTLFYGAYLIKADLWLSYIYSLHQVSTKMNPMALSFLNSRSRRYALTHRNQYKYYINGSSIFNDEMGAETFLGHNGRLFIGLIFASHLPLSRKSLTPFGDSVASDKPK